MAFERDMVADWEYGDNDFGPKMSVAIPERGVFRGVVRWYDSGLLCLMTAKFNVAEDFRNNGIGTRLMMGAAALAKEHGIATAAAFVASPAAIRIRQKVFGDNLVIYPAEPHVIDISFGVEDAFSYLERIGPASPAHSGLIARSDLTQLDTTGWELPREINQPHTF